MNTTVKKQGFTIIEVVLVLAIAGLIFLMVFVALPALQRSQRDTARKNDVSTVSAAVSSYVGNNRGSFPSDGSAIEGYLDNLSGNSDASAITIEEAGIDSVSVSDGEIAIVQEATCGDPGTPEEGATPDAVTHNLETGTLRQYVVVTRLEAGGGSSYCLES